MKNKLRNAILAATLSLFMVSGNVNAQAPVLLKDSVGNGSITDYEAIGNTFFFKLTFTTNRKQLWKTDGSSTGTHMIRDSFYLDIIGLSNINDTLYFISPSTFSSSAPLALWKSDGTPEGTKVVRTLTGSGVGFLTVIDNICYFRLGTALWKTDGTSAGTVAVKTGVTSVSNFYKVANDIVFFAASSGGYQSLWKTDGSSGGTSIIKDSVYRVTSGHSVTTSVTINGIFYFWVANQNILWKTDGTTAGTSQITTLSNVSKLTNHNGTLYFSKFNTSPVQHELWSSNGTSAGTLPISGLTHCQNFTSMGGSLYLSGKTSGTDREPYKCDGTAIGTTLLKDIAVGTAESTPDYFTKVNNSVCFQANDGISGTQIWKTNGTPSGTVMAYASGDAITGLSTVNMIAFNDYLLFIHGGGVYGDLYSILITTASPTVPMTPSNLTVLPQKKVDNGKMKLGWMDNSSDELGFIIARSTDGTNFSLIDTTLANVSTYTDTGLLASTKYYYKVAAYNAVGNSAYSNTESATTLAGIWDVQPSDFVRIYPNPSSGLYHIEGLVASATVSVLNLLGDELTKGSVENGIDLGEYPTGIYLVRIQTEDSIINRRIILSR